MSKLPEIRWKDPWLLRDVLSEDIKQAYVGHEDKLTDEFALETIQRYYDAWKPYESTILTGMCELTGLAFRQNIIDVYVAPFYYSISDPLIIGTKYEADRAVEVLAHELMHRLLTDNTDNHYLANFTDEWRKMFGGEHSHNTLVHIPVHALIQGVFEERVKEPQRIERDKEMYQDYPDYKAAWDYVDKVGYKTILQQLREAKYKQPEDN